MLAYPILPHFLDNVSFSCVPRAAHYPRRIQRTGDGREERTLTEKTQSEKFFSARFIKFGETFVLLREPKAAVSTETAVPAQTTNGERSVTRRFRAPTLASTAAAARWRANKSG